jgi:hypothetical protein
VDQALTIKSLTYTIVRCHLLVCITFFLISQKETEHPTEQESPPPSILPSATAQYPLPRFFPMPPAPADPPKSAPARHSSSGAMLAGQGYAVQGSRALGVNDVEQDPLARRTLRRSPRLRPDP